MSQPVVGVIYSTREGHTAKIAARIASKFHSLGFPAGLFNLKVESALIDLTSFQAVVLAASVHAGHHEPEMVEFVRKHIAQLEHLPTSFVSVTLSEAGAERSDATQEQRAGFEADVHRVIDAFLKETGWHPKHIKPVAGALPYSKYNFLVRFIMKRIARKSGGDTDTSRDYDYTDWDGLDNFVGELAEEFSRGGAPPILSLES